MGCCTGVPYYIYLKLYASMYICNMSPYVFPMLSWDCRLVISYSHFLLFVLSTSWFTDAHGWQFFEVAIAWLILISWAEKRCLRRRQSIGAPPPLCIGIHGVVWNMAGNMMGHHGFYNPTISSGCFPFDSVWLHDNSGSKRLVNSQKSVLCTVIGNHRFMANSCPPFQGDFNWFSSALDSAG